MRRVARLRPSARCNSGAELRLVACRWPVRGVPRYAELVVFADAPGEAAVNYVLFRLMGFPDVKVWTP